MNTKTFTKQYYIDRSNATTIKWAIGRKHNCLPMWIADMDFKCDEKVIKALSDFINTADYGYNNLPEDYYDVLNQWHKTRNNITYRQDWIRFSKGAVNAMYQVIHSLTNKGDQIMINTPLYPPFKDSIQKTKRKVVESKLINNNGYFTFDFEDIENKFRKKKIKMLMLCSPHNPIGRVWKKKELSRLFALCEKYNVLIFSDEVHSDIIMPGFRFIPALSFKKYQNRIISVVAAAKSFSLAVFSHSHIVIPDEKLRNKLISYQQLNNCGSVNVMSALPTYYCYRYADKWLENIIQVIQENYIYVMEHLSNRLEITMLEGTYLIFVNLGRYNNCDSAAKCLMENCHIMTNPGEAFAKQYKNWVRINLATSLDNVILAVDNILRYINQ